MTVRNLDRPAVEKIKVNIALGVRVLLKMGLIDYSGSVSGRIPGTDLVLISAREYAYDTLHDMQSDRVLLIDLEANKLEGNYALPSEAGLHTEIYKAREDVLAVVHDHQTMATVFGAAGVVIPPIAHQAGPVTRPLPVYSSSLEGLAAGQGAEIARTLGDKAACHLKNHGLVVTGPNVEGAVLNAIWIENQAKITFLAGLIGKPDPMSYSLAEEYLRGMEASPGRWRYYVSLLNA